MKLSSCCRPLCVEPSSLKANVLKLQRVSCNGSNGHEMLQQKVSRKIIRGTMGHTTKVAFFKESRHVDISNFQTIQKQSLEKKQFMKSQGCWCEVTGMLPLVDIFPTVAIFCCRHTKMKKPVSCWPNICRCQEISCRTQVSPRFRKKDSRKRCHCGTRLLCSQKKHPTSIYIYIYTYIIYM